MRKRNSQVKRVKFSSERLDPSIIEKSNLELEETMSDEIAKPSAMDSILTSDKSSIFTSGSEMTSSRFAAIGGKRRTHIKKKDEPKVPWPGEESILMHDKRNRQ